MPKSNYTVYTITMNSTTTGNDVQYEYSCEYVFKDEIQFSGEEQTIQSATVEAIVPYEVNGKFIIVKQGTGKDVIDPRQNNVAFMMSIEMQIGYIRILTDGVKFWKQPESILNELSSADRGLVLKALSEFSADFPNLKEPDIYTAGYIFAPYIPLYTTPPITFGGK